MAKVEAEGNDAAVVVHDLRSILGSDGRSFVVRRNGDEVDIGNFEGKMVALYFSASWCGPCRMFTPKLIAAYEELASKGNSFEVVFISADEDEEAFSGYFSKMPWLAIPFSDNATRDRLNELFKVEGIPHLAIIDESGRISCECAVEALREYGLEAYPFTTDRIEELKKQEEIAKKEQTIQSVLATPSRDFLISNNGNKVPISDLEGKIVGLYFSVISFPPSQEFTSLLVDFYEKLKNKGENFEVVSISLHDDDEESVGLSFAGMPWLRLPFKDPKCEKLACYFELRSIPTLVIIGSDGKTLHTNVAEIVKNHGVDAYPFSVEKLKELEERERARRDAQTLESLLVSGELDFVIGKDGNKVPVSELVGKTVLLYFSAHWCGPCRGFTPKFVEVYNKIKEKNEGLFEVIFLSSDRDQSSFDDYYATMPWLALPFGDARKKYLSNYFKVHGIPSVVTIGPTGQTINTDTRGLIADYGADSYPFTADRARELDEQKELKLNEMAKGWPKTVKHALHEEHELVLTRRRGYTCDGCEDEGSGWSFCCGKCDFDLHVECALKNEEKEKEEEAQPQGEGYVCEGDVCYKV